MSRALLAVSAALLMTSTAWGKPLPGVNLGDLDAAEIAALSTLMSEGACPCDTQKSLLECIDAKSCPAATELAGYGAEKLRDGLGVDEVRAAVVRKYLQDHVKYTFDLSDTPRKGPADARIVIVEFADFECPFCAQVRGTLDVIAKKYPKDVVVYFKQFPLSHHVHSHAAARATLAAHRQGRFWPMHDMIFQNQGSLSPQRFVDFATELGIDVERFKKDMEDPAVFTQIERDRKEAAAANLSGTPTLYVNGRLYLDDKTPEAIEAYIEAQLAKAEAPEAEAPKGK